MFRISHFIESLPAPAARTSSGRPHSRHDRHIRARPYPSSLILHPSSFILHPSSFLLPPMPPLAVLSGTVVGQKDKKSRFSSDRSSCAHITYGDAARYRRDKRSDTVYRMCPDAQDTTSNPAKVYVPRTVAPPRFTRATHRVASASRLETRFPHSAPGGSHFLVLHLSVDHLLVWASIRVHSCSVACRQRWTASRRHSSQRSPFIPDDRNYPYLLIRVKPLGGKISCPARVRSRGGRPKLCARKDLRRRNAIHKYRQII